VTAGRGGEAGRRETRPRGRRVRIQWKVVASAARSPILGRHTQIRRNERGGGGAEPAQSSGLIAWGRRQNERDGGRRHERDGVAAMRGWEASGGRGVGFGVEGALYSIFLMNLHRPIARSTVTAVRVMVCWIASYGPWRFVNWASLPCVTNKGARQTFILP
jgi:hypothetical protein